MGSLSGTTPAPGAKKRPGVAEIARLLAAEFEAEQQGLVDAAKPVFPDEVGLAEQILAGGALL